MSSTDTLGAAPPPPSETRVLRRSTTGRVGAGVASGLGAYFGLDPVLFRVLFATSAFFGGAGILAYLIAWAAIPEEGTERAPIDGWVGELRRRRIPLWAVAIAAGLFFWIVAFSWWAPGPFFPIVAVVVLLAVFFGRRDWQNRAPRPVNLTKGPAPADQPAWLRDARAWIDESKAAARARRRRALPIKVATLTTLGATLTTLAIIDSVSGIDLQVYLWTSLSIVVGGVLVGLALRRTPWTVASLLIVLVPGTVAFAGSHVQLGDGIGQREWTPVAAPAATYRVAFGQGILDLRHLATQESARHIAVTAGAGQIRIIAPRTMNLTVVANVHIGQVQVDQQTVSHGPGVSHTITAPAHATGQPITVDVHLADGQIEVTHS